MRDSRTIAPIDGRSLVRVLQGTGEREATPFFYLRLRFPFGDQHHEVGAVRDGRWKLKLPQRGYPQLLEPLVKTELYRHGLLLFDLEADPGEQHDVAAEHPDVVARLTKEIEAFDASLSPARAGADRRRAVRPHRLGEDVARRRRCCRGGLRLGRVAPARGRSSLPAPAAALKDAVFGGLRLSAAMVS